MESHLNRITDGKPRGKRLNVHTLLSHLAAGETKAEIFESFPFLEKEDIMRRWSTPVKPASVNAM